MLNSQVCEITGLKINRICSVYVYGVNIDHIFIKWTKLITVDGEW